MFGSLLNSQKYMAEAGKIYNLDRKRKMQQDARAQKQKAKGKVDYAGFQDVEHADEVLGCYK